MKNIHIIPTDKPSRIYLVKANNLLWLTSNDPFYMESFGSGTQNQHIYITSDEEIKEGDWFMSDYNSFPMHNIKELSEREGILGWKQEDLKNNLKIILTTDQDLIKDGVQAIDNNFLEWFVKNPSCEEIEISHHVGYTQTLYFIVIPKQETLEEVAERLCPNKQVEYDMFIDGAKWQKERSYSEEEVLKILNKFCDNFYENSIREDVTVKWFNKYKKK